MLRPLGGQLQKAVKVQLQFQLHFSIFTVKSQSLGLQKTCQYNITQPMKYI